MQPKTTELPPPIYRYEPMPHLFRRRGMRRFYCYYRHPHYLRTWKQAERVEQEAEGLLPFATGQMIRSLRVRELPPDDRQELLRTSLRNHNWKQFRAVQHKE